MENRRLEIAMREYVDTLGAIYLERARYLLNTDELLEKCSIVEADDETTVAKAVVEIASRGSIKTATYKAIPIDEFIESFK